MSSKRTQIANVGEDVGERLQIAKTILRKKNGAGDIRLPDFKLHYTNQEIQHWHENRNRWKSMGKDRKSTDKAPMGI